jgi:hypothetical protein
MPMRGELPDVAVRRCGQPPVAGTGWSAIAATIWNPDSRAVVMFVAIGLLATIDAVLYFPDFGVALARLAVFP